MIFPKNDAVRARAIADGYRQQYNETLFDILGAAGVVGATLNDRIRAYSDTGASLIDLITNGAIVFPQSAHIVAKLSANDLSLSDGATVTSWIDSVNGLTFTPPSAGGTFQTNQAGGKSCVRFNGSTQYLTAARAGTALRTAIDSRIYTVLVVVKVIANKPLGGIFTASAGGDSVFLTANNSTIGRYAGGTQQTVPINLGEMYVAGYSSSTDVHNGAGTGLQRSYVNGSCVYAVTAPVPVTGADFAVGALSSGSYKANIDLFDVYVWDVELTPAEVFQATKSFLSGYTQTIPWSSGNSILINHGDSLGVAGGTAIDTYPYHLAQSLSLTYGQWTNLSIGGINMTNMQASIPSWSDIGSITGKRMAVAAFEYYNQKTDSVAVLEATHTAYCNAIRALPNTKLCLGTSTSSSSDPDATRVSLCSWLDTNYSSLCDSYAPLHTDAAIGDQNAYATNGGGRGLNLWADIVHFNAAGTPYLAADFVTPVTAIL